MRCAPDSAERALSAPGAGMDDKQRPTEGGRQSGTRATPRVLRVWPRAALRLRRWQADGQLDRQVRRVDTYLESIHPGHSDPTSPVIIFNASTRIQRLSLNGGFGLVAAWALRAGRVRVLQLVCHAGLQQCMLGTKRGRLDAPPPCEACLRMSERLFPGTDRLDFSLDHESLRAWSTSLDGLSVSEMAAWETDSLPVGRLCLPSLRWALRRSTLPDDEATR